MFCPGRKGQTTSTAFGPYIFLFYALILPSIQILPVLQNSQPPGLSGTFPPSFGLKPSWCSGEPLGKGRSLLLIMCHPPRAKKPSLNYLNAWFRHPPLIHEYHLHEEWLISQTLLSVPKSLPAAGKGNGISVFSRPLASCPRTCGSLRCFPCPFWLWYSLCCESEGVGSRQEV